jgi:hypothetical protein
MTAAGPWIARGERMPEDALPDPARSLENIDQLVTVSTEAEVLPTLTAGELNIGDRIVQEIMVMMTANEWDGRRSADALARKYGQNRSAIMARASEAGRHLRLQRAPDVMFDWLLAKLREVIEESQPDRVPAMKVFLDQLDRIEKRRGNRPQDKLSPEEVDRRTAELLADPPPELAAVLERAGWVRK